MTRVYPVYPVEKYLRALRCKNYVFRDLMRPLIAYFIFTSVAGYSAAWSFLLYDLSFGLGFVFALCDLWKQRWWLLICHRILVKHLQHVSSSSGWQPKLLFIFLVLFHVSASLLPSTFFFTNNAFCNLFNLTFVPFWKHKSFLIASFWSWPKWQIVKDNQSEELWQGQAGWKYIFWTLSLSLC